MMGKIDKKIKKFNHKTMTNGPDHKLVGSVNGMSNSFDKPKGLFKNSFSGKNALSFLEAVSTFSQEIKDYNSK